MSAVVGMVSPLVVEGRWYTNVCVGGNAEGRCGEGRERVPE